MTGVQTCALPIYRFELKLYFTVFLGLLWELLHWRQICISRTPKSQWPSGTHQRTNNWRLKEKDLRFHKQERRQMASRTANGNMGATHPIQQGNKTNSFLPGIRLRSNTAGRHHVEVTSTRDIWYSRSRWESPIGAGLTRSDEMQCFNMIYSISSKYATISWLQHLDKVF